MCQPYLIKCGQKLDSKSTESTVTDQFTTRELHTVSHHYCISSKSGTGSSGKHSAMQHLGFGTICNFSHTFCWLDSGKLLWIHTLNTDMMQQSHADICSQIKSFNLNNKDTHTRVDFISPVILHSSQCTSARSHFANQLTKINNALFVRHFINTKQ